MVDLVFAEAAFASLASEYEVRKQLAEQLVVQWKWASSTVFALTPMSLERRGYAPGRLLSTRATQNALAETAVVRKVQNQHSLLLPQRFQQYLQKVYFANFNPVAQQIDVSRNSVAHGVADQSSFSKKSAVIALLVIHQLFYSFGAAPVAVEMASESPSE